MAETRFVDSGGVRIATYVEGNPDGPPLVLAHGWPDSHVLWDGAVPHLAQRFRIIRYDNRGAGASDVPGPVRAYAMERFADDFAAVIAAHSPDRPVHVMAHDWGSVAVWEYLSRPGTDARIASFTSVAGPSTDHYAAQIRAGLTRPYRPIRFARALGLLARLTYWYPFSLPVLASIAMRRGLARRLQNRDSPQGTRFRGDTFDADAANSLKIYRAIAFGSPAKVRTDHYVTVPVQVVCGDRDPVVRAAGFAEEARWTPRLWRRDLRAGHWMPFSHPHALAQMVHELADHLEGGPAARALRRAEVGRRRTEFGDLLVSVTGAGSGIGRATALAFAAAGAEVVVSDIDEGAAKQTAQTVTERGGLAHAYGLDVADVDAVEEFVDAVCAAHGVPDIVVNNAGVGQAGAFLETPREEWERVLDINFGGVVNGCRAFAARMVERGAGGHIVNVASMAAWAPLGAMNAYCTSKAAVYMFSDCLRAELASAGIGLTTLCPGVIDTGIVAATRFDMAADIAERTRARAQRTFGGRGCEPEKVAAAILDAVKRDKAIRPVTPEAYAAYGLSRVLPAVLRRAARADPF